MRCVCGGRSSEGDWGVESLNKTAKQKTPSGGKSIFVEMNHGVFGPSGSNAGYKVKRWVQTQPVSWFSVPPTRLVLTRAGQQELVTMPNVQDAQTGQNHDRRKPRSRIPEEVSEISDFLQNRFFSPGAQMVHLFVRTTRTVSFLHRLP